MRATFRAVIEDTANKFYAVRPSDMDHAWFGIPVAKRRGHFVAAGVGPYHERLVRMLGAHYVPVPADFSLNVEVR